MLAWLSVAIEIIRLITFGYWYALLGGMNMNGALGLLVEWPGQSGKEASVGLVLLAAVAVYWLIRETQLRSKALP